MNSKRLTTWMAVASLGLIGSAALAAEPFMPNGVTKPVIRAELAVPQQGIVKAVLVKPGDVVKVGQVLVELDDIVEQKKLEATEIEAKSDVQIKAAEADLAQKQVDLKRKKEGHANGAFSQTEVEEAELAVLIGELKIELTKQDKQKKAAELAIQDQVLKRMKLLSAANGIVEKIEADPGEVADPSKPSVVVVDNSKIDVEASLPTAQVNKVKVGDLVEVRYQDDAEVKQAKIIYLAPVADAASETRLVRAQMANPENMPTGMSVAVKLSEKTGTAAR